MRNAILVSVLAGVMVLGSAVVEAGAPLSGTYKSTLGQFDEGTQATTWSGAGYTAVGNRLFAQSYAGGVPTADWIIGCPIAINVFMYSNTVVGGNGHKSYIITYAGGYTSLGGPGNPWDGGDAVYTGNIDTFVETRTEQYAGGVIVGAVSNYNVSAHLQGYASTCVAWAIGNGVLIGSIPALSGALQNVKPAGYPAFHDANCNPMAGGSGDWGDVRDLTLSITGCAVATEPSTWGNVKSLYRD